MSKLTIELSPKLTEMLDDLAQKNGTTKVDILRKSVVLMDYVEHELSAPSTEKRHLSITQDGKILKDIVIKG